MALIEDIIKENLQNAVDIQYETIAGKREEPVYLHDQLMTEEFSPNMTYETASSDSVRVTADVVAYDSPLPIKKRDALKSASGNIPKLGLKYMLNEKQMNVLFQLQRTPGAKAQLARKIFADSDKCIYGIKELLDRMLLSAISSGVMLIPEAENTGTAVRVTYDISGDNKFGATYKWTESSATPLSDITRVMEAARDNRNVSIREIWMDKRTLDNIRNNAEIKERFAFQSNFVGGNIPMLNRDQMVSLFLQELGANLNIVDRKFTVEKNGTRTVVDGWEEGKVVFTQSKNLGQLQWSLSAEDQDRVEGVTYAKPNSYILIGMSKTSEPVSKKTFGQAIALPVLQDVDSIYYLDANEAATDAQTEGDANFDYTSADGQTTDSYTRASVITALNLASKKVKATDADTDAELLEKINMLSENQIVIFEDNIVAAV